MAAHAPFYHPFVHVPKTYLNALLNTTTWKQVLEQWNKLAVPLVPYFRGADNIGCSLGTYI